MAERRRQCPVSRSVRSTPNLPPQHRHLVAEREQLDLLLLLGSSKEDEEFEQALKGEIDECPELSPCPSASHRADGSRSEPGQESPCSEARSSYRTVRAGVGWPHQENGR